MCPGSNSTAAAGGCAALGEESPGGGRALSTGQAGDDALAVAALVSACGGGGSGGAGCGACTTPLWAPSKEPTLPTSSWPPDSSSITCGTFCESHEPSAHLQVDNGMLLENQLCCHDARVSSKWLAECTQASMTIAQGWRD